MLGKYETPILIGAGGVLSTIGFFVIKKKLKTANMVGQQKNLSKHTIIINKTTGQAGVAINTVEIATQLGNDFGWAYPSWDPRHWTENDDAIRDLLLSIPKNVMPEVQKQYTKMWNRNLQVDSQKLLPTSSYNQVRNLFI